MPAVHSAQPVAFLAGGSLALLGWGKQGVSREAQNTLVVAGFCVCTELLVLPGDLVMLTVPRGSGCVQPPGEGAQGRVGDGQPEEECPGRHCWAPPAGQHRGCCRARGMTCSCTMPTGDARQGQVSGCLTPCSFTPDLSPWLGHCAGAPPRPCFSALGVPGT